MFSFILVSYTGLYVLCGCSVLQVHVSRRSRAIRGVNSSFFFFFFFMQGLGLDVLSGCLEMWTRISGGTMDGGLTDRSAQVQDQAAAEHLSRETCQCHVLSGR